MEKLEETKLINERIDDLRYSANYVCKNENKPYDEAWNKAENLKGVFDILSIAKINYGIPTYEYKEALMNIGTTINGIDLATISPGKLESLVTAVNMGSEIENFSKNMTIDEIKKEAIKGRIVKEKTMEKGKVFVLEKNKI